MFSSANSKKQGDVGLGDCIAWASRLGYTVSVPLTDSQAYDLIVDTDVKLFRVQVKTVSYRNKYHRYEVSLTVKGGNRSGTGCIKKFDKSKVDALFILTDDNNRYFIPSEDIGGDNGIVLGDKYNKFKIIMPT